MITEVANVFINGVAAVDIVDDTISMEVMEDVYAADVFKIKLALNTSQAGAWPYLDDERLRIWNRISVEGGYPDDFDTLIDGYITHVDIFLTGDATDSYLEISGMDTSAIMDLEEKQLAWTNKKDHEIAQEIFDTYGLSHEVEDTVFSHEESTSTVLQSETDIRFLRRLAARHGFESYVRGGKGFFRSPNLQEPPQRLLAIQFGSETNLVHLNFKLDGLAATDIEVRHIDPIKKQENIEMLQESPIRKLGKTSLSDLRNGSTKSSTMLKRQSFASTQDMSGGLRTAYGGANQFVQVDGVIDSRTYGVLRPHGLVAVKGANESFSGLYYVTQVRHEFTIDEYTQYFKAYRNGIGLTGDEDFNVAQAPFAIMPGVSNTSIGSGNLVLPAQQEGAVIPGGF